MSIALLGLIQAFATLLRAVAGLTDRLLYHFAVLAAPIGVTRCCRGLCADDPVTMLLALAQWPGR